MAAVLEMSAVTIDISSYIPRSFAEPSYWRRGFYTRTVRAASEPEDLLRPARRVPRFLSGSLSTEQRALRRPPRLRPAVEPYVLPGRANSARIAVFRILSL